MRSRVALLLRSEVTYERDALRVDVDVRAITPEFLCLDQTGGGHVRAAEPRNLVLDHNLVSPDEIDLELVRHRLHPRISRCSAENHAAPMLSATVPSLRSLPSL